MEPGAPTPFGVKVNSLDPYYILLNDDSPLLQPGLPYTTSHNLEPRKITIMLKPKRVLNSVEWTSEDSYLGDQHDPGQKYYDRRQIYDMNGVIQN